MGRYLDVKDYVGTHVRYFRLTEYDLYIESKNKKISKSEKIDYYIQVALAVSNCKEVKF